MKWFYYVPFAHMPRHVSLQILTCALMENWHLWYLCSRVLTHPAHFSLSAPLLYQSELTLACQAVRHVKHVILVRLCVELFVRTC